MDYRQQIDAASNAIRKAAGDSVPSLGVVLGSGLGAFAARIQDSTTIPYGDIPHFPQSSVAGHAGELVCGSLGRTRIAVMSGRVHFYEGHDLARVTFPVRVLAALGVKRLLVTNAAGAVNPDFVPGDFMVIDDHINLTGQNPLIGHNDDALGPRFPDMTEAYSKAGRELLDSLAASQSLKLRHGVYAGLTGPSYETPAEIRMLGRQGADAVGMSTVHEVIAARHGGVEVLGLSVITNKGAGLSSGPLSHDEVKDVARLTRDELCNLLEAVSKEWGHEHNG